jgi:hypothetical protein
MEQDVSSPNQSPPTSSARPQTPGLRRRDLIALAGVIPVIMTLEASAAAASGSWAATVNPVAAPACETALPGTYNSRMCIQAQRVVEISNANRYGFIGPIIGPIGPTGRVP